MICWVARIGMTMICEVLMAKYAMRTWICREQQARGEWVLTCEQWRRITARCCAAIKSASNGVMVIRAFAAHYAKYSVGVNDAFPGILFIRIGDVSSVSNNESLVRDIEVFGKGVTLLSVLMPNRLCNACNILLRRRCLVIAVHSHCSAQGTASDHLNWLLTKNSNWMRQGYRISDIQLYQLFPQYG
jgi:hypothetical protein